MNLFVPVVATIAVILIPVTSADAPKNIRKSALKAIAVILLANWIAFSILGGALLTRYLLPMYPLILLLCVSIWRRHLRRWWLIAALSAAAFLSAIWINPPYAFAPEDNLTYRDMIVLHQQAIHLIEHRYPQATVLTAWPATSELSRPEIGYTRHPIKVAAIHNFSIEQMQTGRRRSRSLRHRAPLLHQVGAATRRHQSRQAKRIRRHQFLRLPSRPASRAGRCPAARRDRLAGAPQRRVGRRPPLSPHRRRLAHAAPLRVDALYS